MDVDCPLCRAMTEDSMPVFWHLSGCNMDCDFPFSFYRTRDEWEEEERRRKEFEDEFLHREEQRKEKSSLTRGRSPTTTNAVH